MEMHTLWSHSQAEIEAGRVAGVEVRPSASVAARDFRSLRALVDRVIRGVAGGASNAARNGGTRGGLTSG